MVTSRSASPPATGAVVSLVGALIAIYLVSQFLRNSIGVIAPTLAAELVLSPAEIGLLSSAFFLVFAAVQIPPGMALDRFGPRLCLMVGAAITVVGTTVIILDRLGGLYRYDLTTNSFGLLPGIPQLPNNLETYLIHRPGAPVNLAEGGKVQARLAEAATK